MSYVPRYPSAFTTEIIKQNLREDEWIKSNLYNIRLHYLILVYQTLTIPRGRTTEREPGRCPYFKKLIYGVCEALPEYAGKWRGSQV